jgi:phosphoglycerate dehydrogenase-like enzyme
MKKILITEFMEQDSINLIAKKFNITYDPKLCENVKDLVAQIHFFDAIIVRNKTQVNDSVLQKARNLKFIGRLGVGLDNIDTDFCEKNNIFVQSAAGMNADSVAEYVINCSLSLLKNIPLMHQGTITGQWPRTSIESRELQGKTMGLIGFGIIGKKVSKLAQAFGSRIIAYDPFVPSSTESKYKISLVEQQELFEIADIISIHLPLNTETKDLLNYNSFSLMKKKPIIINSSRGSIVNERDLIRAYQDNLISGFALDVYESEPVKENFFKEIDNTMNCILTPHVAGVTNESNTRVSQFIAEKLIRFFEKITN